MNDKQKLLEEIKKKTDDEVLIKLIEKKLKLFDTVEEYLFSLGIIASKIIDSKSIPTSNEKIFIIDWPYAVKSVIEKEGFPFIMIQNNSFQLAIDSYWYSELSQPQIKNMLEYYIRATGKIIVCDPTTNKEIQLGTGILINQETVITANHVILQFNKYPGYSQKIDFQSEYQVPTSIPLSSLDIGTYRYLKNDIAAINLSNKQPDLPQIGVNSSSICGKIIALIGYPKESNILITDGKLLEKKMLSPGNIGSYSTDYFSHNCSAVGGNSGSPIICLETGQLIGIHTDGKMNNTFPEFNLANRTDKISNLIIPIV